MGRHAESESLNRELLAVRRRVFGDKNPQTLFSINNLGCALKCQGKLPEAEALIREALVGRRETLGDKHHNTLSSIEALAEVLLMKGKPQEAEPLARECYAGFKQQLGFRHPKTVNNAHFLGKVLKALGKTDDETKRLLAKRLKVCALPGCDLGHAVGVELHTCTGCRSVMYCTPVRALCLPD